MAEATNTSAGENIKKAFLRFDAALGLEDRQEFKVTKLKDVYKAAGEIEGALAHRQDSRGVARIIKLLDGLGHYSAVIDVVVAGIDYAPLIWAPIKLCLQIAKDYTSAFEKLMNAYGEIGRNLPRIEELSKAFIEQEGIQALLAEFYGIILDFHSRAYKFVRARAWKRTFDSMWHQFERRFGEMIQSLKSYADLFDREVNAQDIVEARQWRGMYLEDLRTRQRERLEDIDKSEKERLEDEFEKVINWLNVKDSYIQEDTMEKWMREYRNGTADWFLKHEKVTDWIKYGGQRVLWVNGIPGSGKSVLCSQLIRRMQTLNPDALAFFICDFRAPDRNECSNVLRQITSQLISQNRALVGTIYERYYLKKSKPANSVLKAILTDILSSITSPRVLIDGLDECEVTEQIEILRDVRTIVTEASKQTDCKVGIFSQHTDVLEKILKKDPTISLKNEAAHVQSSISAVIHYEMQKIRNDNDNDNISKEVLARTEQKLVEKANGMFLWVRLVIDQLREVNSASDLEKLVDMLPHGIKKTYGRIFKNLERDDPRGSLGRAKALFSWLAFSRRQLKAYEVTDGIVFCMHPHKLEKSTKLSHRELHRCKPLIEIEKPSGNVFFVHSTVQEYILDTISGPFLRREQALYDISIGCVAYVLTSFDLIDPRKETSHRFESIALGYHDLHRYAVSKWLLHLEDLSKAGPLPVTQKSQLDELLKKLCQRHNQLLEMKRGWNSAMRIDIEDEKDFPAFQNVKEFLQLARLIRQHEGQVGQRVRDQAQVESETMEDDPTLFTEVADVYDSTVQDILKPQSERGSFPASVEESIQNFRLVHGNRAYRCRAIACPKRSEGFETESKRDEHEARSHPPSLYCSEYSCPYSKPPGFPTHAKLRKHVREEHSTEDSIAENGAKQKKRSKRHRSEDAGELASSDDEVNELYRRVFKKTYQSENAKTNILAQEPAISQGGVAQEQHSDERSEQDESMDDAPVDFKDSQMCICGDINGDEWDLVCETCGRRAHQDCYYPPPADQPSTHGFEHYCVKCKPREVDRKGAIKFQKAKEAASGSDDTEVAPSLSESDERAIEMLSLIVHHLSDRPMNFADILNTMGIPAHELAGLLPQVAEKTNGEYHLRIGVADDIEQMAKSKIEEKIGKEEREGKREQEKVEEQASSTLDTNKNQDSPKKPDSRQVERSKGTTDDPTFAVGQTVFYACYTGLGPHAHEPSACVGELCIIQGESREAQGTYYSIYKHRHGSNYGEQLPDVRKERLRPFPDRSHTLDDLSKGTTVIALFPGTRKFYKATVVQDWNGSDTSKPSGVEVSFKADWKTESVRRSFVFVRKEAK